MKRQLNKLNENKFELKTVDEKAKLITIKGFSKTELKNIYSQLRLQKGQLILNKNNIIKQLSKITTKDTKELRDFAKKIEGAQQLIQKSKLEEQVKQINSDIGLFSEQIAEILIAVPEVERLPKK